MLHQLALLSLVLHDTIAVQLHGEKLVTVEGFGFSALALKSKKSPTCICAQPSRNSGNRSFGTAVSYHLSPSVNPRRPAGPQSHGLRRTASAWVQARSSRPAPSECALSSPAQWGEQFCELFAIEDAALRYPHPQSLAVRSRSGHGRGCELCWIRAPATSWL